MVKMTLDRSQGTPACLGVMPLSYCNPESAGWRRSELAPACHPEFLRLPAEIWTCPCLSSRIPERDEGSRSWTWVRFLTRLRRFGM